MKYKINKITLNAYDKYNKQNIEIVLCDGRWGDEIDWINSTSSNNCNGKLFININSFDGEDPHPKRWSDLEDIKLIIK